MDVPYVNVLQAGHLRGRPRLLRVLERPSWTSIERSISGSFGSRHCARTMKCPKCGAKNRRDELYCVSCRADLKAARKDESVVFTCPFCDTENPETATECQSCHKPIQSPFVYCTQCGRRNLASDRFCRDCDTPLPAKKGSQEAAPPMPESAPCPSCGKPMERGFLIAPNEGYFRGIRWSDTEALFWPYPGEPLQRGSLFVGNTNIPAFRCTACRTVVLRY